MGYGRLAVELIAAYFNKVTEYISVCNQLDAQNLFHNKLYFMPLHVSSTCAHHQVVKIVKQILASSWLNTAIYTEIQGQQNVKVTEVRPKEVLELN